MNVNHVYIFFLLFSWLIFHVCKLYFNEFYSLMSWCLMIIIVVEIMIIDSNESRLTLWLLMFQTRYCLVSWRLFRNFHNIYKRSSTALVKQRWRSGLIYSRQPEILKNYSRYKFTCTKVQNISPIIINTQRYKWMIFKPFLQHLMQLSNDFHKLVEYLYF